MITSEQHVPAQTCFVGAYSHALFARQQATVTLTEIQQLTLTDIFEPPDLPDGYMTGDWLLDPGKLIAAQVRALAARDPHHTQRWVAECADLATNCESWHPAQAFAVLAAIARYWTALDIRDLPRHRPQEAATS